MGDSEIVTALLSPIHNLAEQWFYPALKISAAKKSWKAASVVVSQQALPLSPVTRFDSAVQEVWNDTTVERSPSRNEHFFSMVGQKEWRPVESMVVKKCASHWAPQGGLLVMKSDNDNLCIANVIPEKLQVTMLLVALVARSAHFTLWLNSFSKCWPGCLNIGPRSQIMAFINLIWNRLHHKSHHHMVDFCDSPPCACQ